MMKPVCIKCAFAIVAITCALSLRGQQVTAELHVNDIRASQPDKFISASQPCQSATHAGIKKLYLNSYIVEQESYLQTMSELYSISDEVILAEFKSSVNAIAPDSRNVIKYIDSYVISSWKGTHAAGSIITITIPDGSVNCDNSVKVNTNTPFAMTSARGGEWQGEGSGPYLLFLKQSSSQESQILPGYRLAGGDGLQGLFGLESRSKAVWSCHQFTLEPSTTLADNCVNDYKQSDLIIRVPNNFDPLKKIYAGHPVLQLLKDVEAASINRAHANQDNNTEQK
jgi:hypothetical protein